MNHGDLHVVLNQPLYQLWLFACNLTAVNSIMYLCKIQLSSVHSHPTFHEAWYTGTMTADKTLTKPKGENEKWQKTKMKNYVTLNIPQTWHSLLLLRLTLEQMARNEDTIKSATEAIFILKFKTTTTYCSAKCSRSVTEKKMFSPWLFVHQQIMSFKSCVQQEKEKLNCKFLNETFKTFVSFK